MYSCFVTVFERPNALHSHASPRPKRTYLCYDWYWQINEVSLPYERKTGQIRLVNIFSVNMTSQKWKVIFSDITSIFCIRCDLWHFPTSSNNRVFTDCIEQNIVLVFIFFFLFMLPESSSYSRRIFWTSVCPSVRPSVCPSVRFFVQDRF